MTRPRDLLEEGLQSFAGTFEGRANAAARAPGRIELIGNHVDYNGGLVMGVAIDRSCLAVGRNREDREVHVASAEFDGHVVKADLHSLSPLHGDDRWANYALGVVYMLRDSGIDITSGLEIAIVSDVPRGAGLSSSAAVELAVAELVLSLNEADIDPVALVKLCRRTENEFVGVPTGLLDQGVSKFGQKDRAVLIDCREIRFSTVPLPPDTRFWVFNTHTQHAHAGSYYATRHRECLDALDVLRETRPDLEFLTDAQPSDLELSRDALGDVLYRRARHVVSEHERVRRMIDILQTSDERGMGDLLYASHESSRTDFENSTSELDFLVDRLRGETHVIGARLTGGGFGGAVLAVTRSQFTAEQAEAVAADYWNRFGAALSILPTTASDGSGAISRTHNMN